MLIANENEHIINSFTRKILMMKLINDDAS